MKTLSNHPFIDRLSIALRTLRVRSIAFVLLLLVSLISCSKKNVPNHTDPKIVVSIEKALTMDVPIELHEIGTVEASSVVSITTRVSGQLVYVGFKEGQDVKKGEVLFKIDSAPFVAALAQTQANLKRDQVIEKNQELNAQRYKELVQKDYVTKEQFDAVMAASAEAKATVEADQALVQNALLNLSYCTIRAPISGRSGNLLVKEGNMVVSNAPTPLIIINCIEPVFVSFSIPEQYLSAIRYNTTPQRLVVSAYPNSDSSQVYDGILSFIDNMVDEATGTILLKATFPNKNRNLWPGQFVRVTLELGKQTHATVVPASAVQSSQQGTYLYVVKNTNTVELRTVVIDTRYDRWIVIKEGVVPGETVVIDGQFGLIPGAEIIAKATSIQ